MNKLASIVLLSISMTWPLLAQTSRFYVTDDGKTFFGDVIPITLEQIENAKNAKESRPVDQDPEGHWGPASEGFQLSIRIEKDSFTNGEPVVACIILRNVSDRHLKYPVYSNRDTQGMVVLTRGQEQAIGNTQGKPSASFLERVRATRNGRIFDWPSPVGTQRKFVVNLNQVFDLTTNGLYVAQAKREIPRLDQTGLTAVVSGKMTFSIIADPKRSDPHP